MICLVLVISVLYDLPGIKGDITGGTFMKNKYSTAEVLLVKDKVGPKMCVKACLRINACVAVNYIRAQLTCELLLGTTPSSGLHDKDGYHYTDMTQWQTMKGPCFPNPCNEPGRITKCVEVNEAKHICVRVVLPPCTCPSDYIQYNQKCYYFSDVEKDWFGAKSFCESAGMILAEPRTREEINLLRNTATTKGHGFFLGGTDLHEEGNWIWTNSNVGITITDWYTGQPNNEFDQDCLSIQTSFNFRWNDVGCETKLRFVCEKKNECT